MAQKSFNTRVKCKRDTEANWTANDPILLDGEIIIVDKTAGGIGLKVGDGSSVYSSLDFYTGLETDGTTIVNNDGVIGLKADSVTGNELAPFTTVDATSTFGDDSSVVGTITEGNGGISFYIWRFAGSQVWNYIKGKLDSLTSWITKSMLADEVQTSLGKADTALQSVPAATSNTIGGVMPDGTTITITDTGTISATVESYTLPTASADTLGGVKIGDGLSITDDGILSASKSSSGGFVVSSTTPEDTNLLWIDTANNSIMKYYDKSSTSWKTVGSVWS